MATSGESDHTFSETYARLREYVAMAADEPVAAKEETFQRAWRCGLFCGRDLRTDEGFPFRVLAPGWWNKGAGPDFTGVELEWGGRVVTGSVELHMRHGDWRRHGHHLDPGYENVILEVICEKGNSHESSRTLSGRRVPCLASGDFLNETEMASLLEEEEQCVPTERPLIPGNCVSGCETKTVYELLSFAGEWRMLSRARRFIDRASRVGMDQALYEGFMEACGYAAYKEAFLLVARSLPYERARQMACHDPRLLEAAVLGLAGLLPESMEEPNPYFNTLAVIRDRELSGLKALPILWKRSGVRPLNYPERRLTGAALFISRTAREGINETLNRIWRASVTPRERLKLLERVFPVAQGYWTTHCGWQGKPLPHSMALLGRDRIRSIIGNVFASAALAEALDAQDLSAEKRVSDLLKIMPGESLNHIVRSMIPRFFSDAKHPRLSFMHQQGLLQLYQDWCARNGSCSGCPVGGYNKIRRGVMKDTGTVD